jgi:hypothetical protein
MLYDKRTIARVEGTHSRCISLTRSYQQGDQYRQINNKND